MDEESIKSYKDIGTGECLKTLGAEIREFRAPSIATPLCMILEVIMEMMIPLLMARIIDFGVQAGNMGVILSTGALMLFLALIGLLAGIGGGVFGAEGVPQKSHSAYCHGGGQQHGQNEDEHKGPSGELHGGRGGFCGDAAVF